MALNLNARYSPLPGPPTIYDPQYIRQLIRVLELYFNQLDNWNLQVYNALTNPTDNLILPYGSFYQDGNTVLTGNITNNSTTPIPVTSTAEFANSGFLLIGSEIIQYTSKTATTFDGTITRGVKGTTNVSHNSGDAVTEVAGVTSTTSEAAILDTVVASNDIYVGSASANVLPDSRVYFANTGIYNIQFSMQLLNFTASEDNVTVWFKKNGTDIPATASVQQVNSKHGSGPGAAILALNFVEEFAANDYFQIYWASNTGNTVLATYPPGTSPTHPVSPSMILTVSFVSAVA